MFYLGYLLILYYVLCFKLLLKKTLTIKYMPLVTFSITKNIYIVLQQCKETYVYVAEN